MQFVIEFHKKAGDTGLALTSQEGPLNGVSVVVVVGGGMAQKLYCLCYGPNYRGSNPGWGGDFISFRRLV
jgi:hypothetical protein